MSTPPINTQLHVNAAVEIIKAALASKAITLHGPHSGAMNYAADYASADAAYLRTLIAGLISPEPPSVKQL